MQPTDYVSLIEMLLARIGATTAGERAEAYKRAHAALNGTLDKIDPPMSTRERNGELRKLGNAIRMVDAKRRAAEKDADARASRNIAAAFGALQVPPLEGYARVSDGRPSPGFVLRPLPALDTTPARMRINPAAFVLERIRIVAALVMRQMVLATSRDRSYYFWLIIETAIQIGFIIFGYWLLGHEYVLDMPASAFAVVGASAWLMFRTTVRILLASESVLSIAQFPKVFHLDILLSQSLFLCMFYFVVMAAFMVGLDFFGYVYHIRNPLGVVGWWMGLWLLAFAVGLSGGALSQRFAWGRRFMQIALRVLMPFTGVAFVTEQLPEDYKLWFIWSPILHGIQELRGAMFVEYRSEDASALYFLSVLAFGLAYGFAADRAARLRKSRL